jgi:hypothetical protein
MTIRSIAVFTAFSLCATIAQAGNQLFEASWTVKAFGNELTGGTGASEFYSAFGIPQGVLCNPNQPRCPFESTPTDGSGGFNPLGGHPDYGLYCAPWANWQGYGTTARPAKGATVRVPFHHDLLKIPPLYRNPQFFTPGGEPDTMSCTPASRSPKSAVWPAGGKGLVQAGQPVTGTWGAITTGTQKGGFSFAPAPVNGNFGLRIGQGDRGYTTYGGGKTQGSARSGQVGEIGFLFGLPYIYTYTYATLRNDAGVFGPGQGPGSFNLVYHNHKGTQSVASINVKQGAAKFGGTMKMLGALTSKNCYFINGGCVTYFQPMNWRYDAVGAPAYTYGSVVTQGYLATYRVYKHIPGLDQKSTIDVEGLRFPWTTGSVTVTAARGGKWRWPHKTVVHYAHGYDNRNTTTPSGLGTVQLVTPVLTRWLDSSYRYETAGIGILRIKFVPEPQTWMMLVAGASLLCVGARMRGR